MRPTSVIQLEGIADEVKEQPSARNRTSRQWWYRQWWYIAYG